MSLHQRFENVTRSDVPAVPVDMLSLIAQHRQIYNRIAQGRSLADMLAIPSYHQISHMNLLLHPRQRIHLNNEQFHGRDMVLLGHLIKEMSVSLASSRGDLEYAERYDQIVHTFQRFDTSPKRMLSYLGDAGVDIPEFRAHAERGAVAFVKLSLSGVFSGPEVAAGRYSELYDRRQPQIDRLNLLFSPLRRETAMELLSILEQGAEITRDGDIDLAGYVDRILPEGLVDIEDSGPNTLSKKGETVESLIFAPLLADFINDMKYARTAVNEAEAFLELVTRVRVKDIDKKISSLPEQAPSFVRPGLSKALKSAALSFVNVHMKEILTSESKRTSGDERVFLNARAAADERLNALFRGTGVDGLELLDLLEQVGFTLEEPDLVDQILSRSSSGVAGAGENYNLQLS